MLQLAATAALMRRHPGVSEGDLVWMRQQVVSTPTCAAVARAAGLPQELVDAAPATARVAAGAIGERESVQAALAEAVIGAAWLDLGPEAADTAVQAAFGPALVAAVPGARDPKTALQEEVARRGRVLRYELVGETGPPHERTFTSRALVDERAMGTGSAGSKRGSETAAAREALAAVESSAEAAGVAPC